MKDRSRRDIRSGMRAQHAWISLWVCACSQDAAVADSFDVTTGGTAVEGTTTGAMTTAMTSATTDPTRPADSSGSPSGSESDGGGLFDVGNGEGTTGEPVDFCSVGEDIDGIGACATGPLAPSFAGEVQWSWGAGIGGSLTTPLVANLTDDNGDGVVDLCDTPDIVVLVRYPVDMNEPGAESPTRIVVLDGNSGPGGDVHWELERRFAQAVNPALGDIDGDGEVEIIAVERDESDLWRLVAISNTGEVEWVAPVGYDNEIGFLGHVALADMDADGDVEIMAGQIIADHQGNTLAVISTAASSSGFAVDLDDDGDLEYVHATGAHHHDGTPYFQHIGGGDLSFPQVADIDDDGLPEVVYSDYPQGIAVYEHDGALKLSNALPDLAGLPAALHDMDGDNAVDIAVGYNYVGVGPGSASFSVLEFADDELTAAWTKPTVGGCCAGGTAFDFLGDGTAEAIFGDDQQVYVFDEIGTVLTTTPRSTPTGTDYPVVADVDNDGSAEIVFVAEDTVLRVIRDADEGWVSARRIWNQHAYHVTNVREDGTIPTVQPKNWATLNTFRTQAQRGDDGVCDPAG